MKKITHTPTETVLDVLRRSRCEGDRLHLPEQLDRKLYLEVMKALELLGGAWIRKWKCHVFDGEDAQLLVDDVLDAGEIVDLKKTYQFFPTPPDVVARLIALAELKPGMSILEPSAGDGAIVRALPRPRTAAIMSGYSVYACEIQGDKRRQLPDAGAGVLSEDFLSLTTGMKFDRVIANPPFARGQDVEHVRKMIDHLKPGGRLVTVMSPSWRTSTRFLHAEFRARLERDDISGWDWRELEAGAFRVSGTDVRTGILVVDKAQVPS